ncbi:MAG TPA: hypothetical protein VK501_16235 [Baekduia sp.]|uniref:hypothetical protein n=1 Tax=Baekduia sp. TaxID=2600305 RepID=UPI002C2A8B34|nr:hypothetical protein [Baekduia sp.]HMJ35458.1 hypothetical protein [Baekduia sp.]
MSRRVRLTAVLLALAVAAALGVSACGGSSSAGGGGDATALLTDTFGADHPIRSGRVDANLDVDLKGLPQLTEPLSLHLTGPFQSNGGKNLPDFALELDLASGTRPVTLGAVFAKGGAYLTIEGRSFDLGNDLYAAFKQGYEKAKADGKSSSAAPSLSALGISPMRWLKDPQNKGTEDIAGTETDHVAAGVDVPRLLDDVSTLLGKAKSVTSAGGDATGTAVPTQLTADQRAAIARSVASARVDVWTGRKDHTLRKVALDVQVDVPEDLQARAGGLKTGHVTFQLTVAQLNQPQKIAKPAGARPLSELRASLEQLGLIGSSTGSGAGAATTTTPSTTAPSTTTPAPSTGPQDPYGQCIVKAGDDLAKVQDCAALLK